MECDARICILAIVHNCIYKGVQVTSASDRMQSPKQSPTSPIMTRDCECSILENLSDGTFLIDHKTLPFIFRFNFAALRKLRMSTASHIPPIAIEIFSYLKEKLTMVRHSQGGSRYPNRMKYEQKVKFVMRAYNHCQSSFKKERQSNNIQHYNRQHQINFFTREDVRQHFLEEMPKALRRKKAENERKILHLERDLETIIQISYSQPNLARQLFREKVQRKQLPWTDNMFMDISDFSRQIYLKYTDLSYKNQREIIKKNVFYDGEWEVNDIKIEALGESQDLTESCVDISRDDVKEEEI